MKHLHTITLFGRTYSFQSDAPDDRAEQVMAHLAEELKRLGAVESEPSAAKNETALLLSAALNITNAYVELETAHAALTAELDRRTRRLTERLSSVGHLSQAQ